MAGIKSLVKDTAVYGLSSIIGRFLNWGLVPLYTYLFDAAQYGVVSYIYSFVAVLIVVLNYGMETGFFRYANKEKDFMRVYSTALMSLSATSLLFVVLLTMFLHPVSTALKLPHHPDYVWMMGFTVAIVLFASVRERVNRADCPACFKGFPIALISAGLLALAFMGFSGLKVF